MFLWSEIARGWLWLIWAMWMAYCTMEVFAKAVA